MDDKKYWVGDHTWLIKSGNPGYLPGRPLLSGILTHEGEGLPLRNPISNAQQQDSEGASGYGGNWVIKSDPLYQVWPQATLKFILLISVFTNQTLLKKLELVAGHTVDVLGLDHHVRRTQRRL